MASWNVRHSLASTPISAPVSTPFIIVETGKSLPEALLDPMDDFYKEPRSVFQAIASIFVMPFIPER